MRISQPVSSKILDESLKDKSEVHKLALLKKAIDEGEYVLAQQLIDHMRRHIQEDWIIGIFQQRLNEAILDTGEKV